MAPNARSEQKPELAEDNSMPTLAACVGIVENGRILLTKRRDFAVWCLPGGHVEEGESLAQAAIREALEETGLEIELTRFVGIYSRPNWNWVSHVALFAGRVIGGQLQPQPDEVLEARYFSGDELDQVEFFAGHHQRTLDVLDGIGNGVARCQDTPWPFEKGISREELYRRRDESGLSRREFYLAHFGRDGSADDKLEVGGR